MSWRGTYFYDEKLFIVCLAFVCIMVLIYLYEYESCYNDLDFDYDFEKKKLFFFASILKIVIDC